jgi:hypothetical protein
VVAVSRGHGAETGQSIGEHMASGDKVAYGQVRDRFWTTASYGCDPEVNLVTRLVQGDGRNGGKLFYEP